MSILELFVSVDEFWQQFEPLWQRELLAQGALRRRRATRLHPSEIMTLIIWFHQSGYRTFKAYYTQEVVAHLQGEFPHLVSYTRFVELMGRMVVPLTVYLSTQRGAGTGISFIDVPLIPRRWRSVILHAFSSTRSLPTWRRAGRPRWAGFTGSSGMWWSMTKATSWPMPSHRAMSIGFPMIRDRWPTCCVRPRACSVS